VSASAPHEILDCISCEPTRIALLIAEDIVYQR